MKPVTEMSNLRLLKYYFVTLKPEKSTQTGKKFLLKNTFKGKGREKQL